MLAIGRGELVLGRCGRRGDQVAVVLDQPVQQELGRALHERIGPFAQEVDVAAEEVALPEVLAEPRPGHGPAGPDGIALAEVAHGRGLPPEVGVVMGHPTVGPVVDPGRFAPVDAHLLNEVEQRLVALGQIGRLGQPVVHLRVDVDRVVGTPRRTHLVVPDALEVGGLGARPR